MEVTKSLKKKKPINVNSKQLGTCQLKKNSVSASLPSNNEQ